MLFGANSAPAYARMAREGAGYVGGAIPAPLVAPYTEGQLRGRLTAPDLDRLPGQGVVTSR